MRLLITLIFYCSVTPLVLAIEESPMLENVLSFKTTDLLELIDLTGVEPLSLNENASDLENLERLNTTLQSHFLRGKGLERWDIVDSPELEAKRVAIWNTLKKLGFVDAKHPQQQKYDYALLLGALEARVDLRRQHLETVVAENKIEIDKVALLGGQRPLRDSEPCAQVFSPFLGKVPETEIDMLEHNYYNARATMPDLLKQVPVSPINAPMKENAHGELIRPNTQDTLDYFKKLNPIPGKVLAISNQPHCQYQDAVIRGSLRAEDGWEVETIGVEASEKMTIGNVLDAIARYVYQSLNNYKAELKATEEAAIKATPTLLFSKKATIVNQPVSSEPFVVSDDSKECEEEEKAGSATRLT